MLKIIDSDLYHLFNDDPVRPHLTAEFRTSSLREAFALYDDDEEQVQAVICCAYANSVPITESELDYYSQAASAEGTRGRIAVFYTVWSYSRGAGTAMVLAARDWCRDHRGCERFVTLSPLTDMAEKFHLRNGATLLDRGSECQNFEYATF